MLNLSLSYLAGLLTTLSPCVLPILPIMLGGAVQKDKLAPLKMALGLVISFTFMGIFLANIGPLIGITEKTVQTVTAVVLIIFSLTFLTEKGDALFKRVMNPMANIANNKMGESSNHFFIGLLLGAVWAPCSGPTLGLALGLATQEGSRLYSSILFLLFGIGAATPLLLIAYGARKLIMSKLQWILGGSKFGKKFLGFALLIFGIFILTGLDKSIEIAILKMTPDWISEISTRF